MSRTSFKRNGLRSGLSRADSLMSGFSGDFFLPELRSDDGLAREVDGDGEGGLLGAGEAGLGLIGSAVDRIWWLFSSGTVIRRG